MSHLKCFSPDDDAQQPSELAPQENDSAEQMLEAEQMLDAEQVLEQEVVESLSELAAEVQQATQPEPQPESQPAGQLELKIAAEIAEIAETDEADADDSPGGLLAELERRQDAVLLQLDALNDEVERVLKDLGVRLDDAEAA